jgi:pre-rRNA-processing protein RIX1
MAPSRQPVSTGRLLVERIANTPTEQLPNVTQDLLELIEAAKDDLAPLTATSQRKGSGAAEQDVIKHHLKTQLSTILQSRKHQGRWAAVILIKAFVEVGGHEILQGCSPWVRAMVGMLGVCHIYFY